MIRRPENVHIYFFREAADGEYEFALMQRSDNHNIWQGASGGVRDGETSEEAASRVSACEAGAPRGTSLYKLTTTGYVPSAIFGSYAEEWGDNVVVVPIHLFAMQVDDIILTEQHKCVKWCSYIEAEKLFTFESQRIGLWELNQRLIRGNLFCTK